MYFIIIIIIIIYTIFTVVKVTSGLGSGTLTFRSPPTQTQELTSQIFRTRL